MFPRFSPVKKLTENISWKIWPNSLLSRQRICGYGMLMGPTASTKEIELFRELIKATPAIT